ncbi:MFS transporter [Pseudomonas sp. CM25]|uniref:MFS transporter n=1 Tax=Pseudomonas sp. CM25 TaxID=2738448 RepID=UPI0015537167|nr:MFS transporter [Pseudomonas sp. CM25]
MALLDMRRRITCVYLLGFFLDLINTFITAVVAPSIGEALQADVATLAWVSTAYLLGLMLGMLPSRWLGERLGERPVLLGSLVLFSAATMLILGAGQMALLLPLRGLQGFAAGLFIPVGQALVYRLYAADERPRVTMAIMATGLLAPAVSPVLGGWLSQHMPWQWVLLASLPIALITLVLGAVWLPRTPATAAPEAFDGKGMLLAGAGIGIGLLGMTEAGNGAACKAAAWLLLGAGLLAGYIRHSRRSAAPLVDFSVAREPVFAASLVLYLAIPGLFIGVNLLAMLYLQAQLGWSPSAAGSLMLPWTLGAALAIASTTWGYKRFGPVPLLLVGIVLQIPGYALLALASSVPSLTIAYALLGLGGSLCTSVAQSAAFSTLPASALGQASTLWALNRQLSFCLGVTSGSLVFGLLATFLGARTAYQTTFMLAGAVQLLCLATLGWLRLFSSAKRKECHEPVS